VPASLVRSAGGWHEPLSLINDFEFFSRMVLASPGVAHVPEARSYYRSGIGGSLSGQRSARAWQSAFESVRLGTARLLSVEDSPRTRHACANVWRNLTFDAYPDAPPELRREGEQRVAALGEKLGRPAAGPWFTFAARLLGWKAARRLQAARRRHTRP
jgi:hypothetical protein